MSGINFDSLNFMVEHVRENEALIKQYYKPDTINAEFGRLMNECKGIRKKLSNLTKKRTDFGDEMNALKHQFMDLKTDIGNGLFTKEQVKGYLGDEKKNLEMLQLTFMEFYDNQTVQSEIYYHDVPQVDDFIKQLITECDTIVE